MQYVVEVDALFLEYIETKHLILELNRSHGWDYQPLGAARIPLRSVIRHLQLGLNVAKNAQFHTAEVGIPCKLLWQLHTLVLYNPRTCPDRV